MDKFFEGLILTGSFGIREISIGLFISIFLIITLIFIKLSRYKVELNDFTSEASQKDAEEKKEGRDKPTAKEA